AKHARRRVKFREGRLAAIAGESLRVAACNGLNVARSCKNLANHEIVCIRDEDVSRRIEEHAGWKVELRACGRSAISTGCAGRSALRVIADHCGDDSGRRYLANNIVSCI